MKKIYTSILDLIGRTPLLEPARFNAAQGVGARLLVKLEAFNPGGSAKDRIAKAMIEDAEAPPPKAIKPSSPCRKPCPSNGASSSQPTAQTSS